MEELNYIDTDCTTNVMQSIIKRELVNIKRRKRLMIGYMHMSIMRNPRIPVYFDILGYEGCYYYISINKNDIEDIYNRYEVAVGDILTCDIGFFIVVNITKLEEAFEIQLLHVNTPEMDETIDKHTNLCYTQERIEEANDDLLEKQMLSQDIYL